MLALERALYLSATIEIIEIKLYRPNSAHPITLQPRLTEYKVIPIKTKE